MYVIGKTGMGKSTLLENMAIQDIQNGEGMAFLDPHGKTVDLLLEYVPEHRMKDVIYVAPFDLEHPIAFNVLEDTSGDVVLDPVRAQLIVSGLMSTFKKIWEDQWSARMEYILNYTLLALLEIPEATLLDVNRMLSDKKFRNDVISKLKEPTVRMYWEKEFAGYTEKTVAEAVPAIQNKVGQFISNSLIRNIIGQKFSSFDLRRAMDEKKIILFNFSIGRIGEDAVNLLGSLFVTKIYLAAMSRADKTDRQMKDIPNFYLYVDEFQNFTNDSFAQILAQARKYRLGLIVAHQYVKQMTEVVRDAVFGNVGTMIAFRVGAEDGEALEKEFQPAFVAQDFVNLGRFQMYLTLMIDGVTSSAFSAVGLGPWPEASEQFVKQIIDQSRATYARPREVVEKHILEWTLGANNSTNNSGAPVGQQSAARADGGGQRKSEPRSERSEVPRSESRSDRSDVPRSSSPRREEGRGGDRGHERSSEHHRENSRPRQESRKELPQQSQQPQSTPKFAPLPPMPEIPPSPRKPQPTHQPAVHNPFKTAFTELSKPAEPSTDTLRAAVETAQKKKEVEEGTLKDILGI
jgi:hypothetical protein